MKLLPGCLAVMALMGGLASGAAAETRRSYIVQLAAEPAASYDGRVAGYAATQPAAGSRFDSQTRAARAYLGYLASQQQSVAATIGAAPILARYAVVYNGFAALLTDAEVQALRGNPLVAAVHVDEQRKPDTISTPAFLGLSAPGGLWSQRVDGLLLKGENIIVGIVDSGIWPENPSYADRLQGKAPSFTGPELAYTSIPAGWKGSCVAGTGFVPAIHCNNKLIGAQYFNAGFKAFLAGGQTVHWSEFLDSPRDSVAGATGHGGHGSHTASTAAGNMNAPAVLGGVALGPASGMAPRARIAAYKVCYTYVNPAATDGTGSENTCFTSDAVSAIDKAVADGVHVINFSISGSQTSVNDPAEQAFLRAANAGVFVATSAGNNGPAVAVAHVSPWLTAVAAASHDRLLSADVTLGNGAKYSGASMNPTPLPPTPMIRAQDAGLAGADPTNLRLCFSSPAVLDPAKVTGKVVVCDRGTNARVDKSLAVKNAGGAGMVMVDNGAGLVAEVHSVPTVHVSAADGAAIKTYAATPGATAAISAFYIAKKPAPMIANFSSRGPNQGDANILKPDLSAPGVDVIAAFSPALTNAERDAVAAGTLVPPSAWASEQGTSMASPHVAGIAALLRQAHPQWTPAAIKSAMMTTATATLDDGLAGAQNGLLPWSQGAGQVAPNAAVDPGLVYDLSRIDFIRYQCKVNRAAVSPASDCTTYGVLDETYNLNLPSITVGSVVGTTTVTRSVTNVGGTAATYAASVNVPGFTAIVTPAALSLAAGETKSFTVKLTAAGAADSTWSFGSLTWTDGVHTVKSPVTARTGKLITAPAQINANTASGSRLITLQTNFAGRMGANKGGLKPVTLGSPVALNPQATSSAQLKTACIAGADTASIKVYPVTIPANTIVARFALRDADIVPAAPTQDHDMIIVAPDGSSLYSGNDGSNESVQVSSPAAGSYKVCVVAYGGTAGMTHRLSSWVVTTADASSNFNVLLPGVVYSGGSATVGLSWSGLADGGRYVGGVQFKDAAGLVQATTAVHVEPGATLPLTGEPVQPATLVK